MIKNVLILLALCLGSYAVGHYAFQNMPNRTSVEKTVPAFEITDINNTSVTDQSLKGKIVLINFWASWCAPCVKEFPDLIQLAENNPDDVVLLALSSDLNEGMIEKFLIQHNFKDKVQAENIMIALDKNNIGSTLFDVYKLPETLITSRDLIIKEHLIGAEWSSKEVQNTINRLK